jgi:glycosyltransferase involved in cell wall biosynthesis
VNEERKEKTVRIIADVASLQGENRDRGISRYVAALLHELLLRPEVHLVCRAHSSMKPLPSGLSIETTLRSDHSIQAELKASGDIPTCFLLTSPFEWGIQPADLVPHWVKSFNLPLVGVGFDVIPKIFPDIYLPDKHLAARYEARLELVRTFDRLLAISKSAGNDLITFGKVLNSKVQIIGSGVDLRTFNSGIDQDTRSATAIDPHRDIVLCVGGFEWRKNIPRLLVAWSMLSKEIRRRTVLKVVCTLTKEGRAEWENQRMSLRLREDEVEFTGYIEDAELVNLYRSSTLVIAPYLYEGFGLPVLEALATSTPVLTSNVSALPEALEFPASTFDPYDSADIARCLTHYFTDQDFRDNLNAVVNDRRLDYSWNAVAERAINAISSVVRKPRLGYQAESRPKRIAIIGPTSPSFSGVAIYTDKLIPHLRKLSEVSVFRDDSRSHPIEAFDQFQPSAGLASRAVAQSPSQEVLAIIGNSDYHHMTYLYALDHPCSIWLHDLSLTGLVVSYIKTLGSLRARHDWLRNLLSRCGAPNFSKAEFDENYVNESFYRRNGIRFIEPLLARARLVFVNSEMAARVVLQTGYISEEQVVVLPLAVEKARPVLASRKGKLIVSLGWVSPTKRPEVLIEALVELGNEVSLAFVGPIEDRYRDALMVFASNLGIQKRVEFVGAVSEDHYRAFCSAAYLGVQLRNSGNSESSATVLDLLASGVPVITDIPSCGEFPDGTVLMLKPMSDARSVAAACNSIIDNDRIWESYSRAGSEFAQRHSFERLADVIVEAIN